jgi:hypothetical protein
MLGQRAAGLHPARDDVDHTRREAGAAHEVAEQQHGQRRLWRGQQHGRAAGRERRTDLGRSDQDGVVEGRDRGDHADRPVGDHADGGVGGVEAEVAGAVLDGGLGQPAQERDRRVDVVRLDVDGRADLRDQRIHQPVAVLLDQGGEPVQHGPAERSVPPDAAVKGCVRGLHRLVHLGQRRARELRHKLLGGRAHNLQRLAFAGTIDIADQQRRVRPALVANIHDSTSFVPPPRPRSVQVCLQAAVGWLTYKPCIPASHEGRRAPSRAVRPAGHFFSIPAS